MNQPNLAPKIKNLLDNFIKQLKGIYENELVSIILYGSAVAVIAARRICEYRLAGAVQYAVHRQASGLALDVPQRDVDDGDGGHDLRPR